MVNVAVAGLGYWGPNLLRNFDQLPTADVRYAIDSHEERRQKIQRLYPHIPTSSNFDDALKDDQVQAIIVATGAASHYELAKKALEAGKDVFVEKPITLNVSHAKELVDIAAAKDRILMVGHLLKYHPAVIMLKDYIDKGEIGDIFYAYSTRVNLGQVRKDENALWSLGPHDISVLLYLIDDEPVEVSARGESYLREGVEDVVFVSIKFKSKVGAHMQLSWLDPHKVRKMTVVGSKKMIVFDDMESSEKVRLYDKGAYFPDYDTFGEYISLRFGDIYIPKVDGGEPLRTECQHFVDCVENRTTPISDGLDGLKVLQILDAAERSIKNGGNSVPIEGI